MPLNHVLVVLNPISGDINKDEIETLFEVFCKSCGTDFNLYRTIGGPTDEQYIRDYQRQHPVDAVVAVGGDGTVNLVAKILIGQSTPLGIVPLGSGNGLSKDLKIPQRLTEALAVIEKFNAMPIDTLTVNGLPCVHIADVGFNAVVVDRYAKEDTRGFATYAWSTMREFADYQPGHYQVTTDGGDFEGLAFMVAFTNANAFGSNTIINPAGIINDGKFEVCILKEFPKFEGVGVLYRLLTGGIDQSLHTETIHCTRATIRNPQRQLMQIDGEPMESVETIEVAIRPGSLNVLVP